MLKLERVGSLKLSQLLLEYGKLSQAVRLAQPLQTIRCRPVENNFLLGSCSIGSILWTLEQLSQFLFCRVNSCHHLKCDLSFSSVKEVNALQQFCSFCTHPGRY